MCNYTNAQTTPISDSGFQWSVRAGYDMPSFKNNTPYIDYKAGPEFGTSLDYYWSWFGIGFDFDYINNGTKSTYPTANLFSSSGVPLTSFTIQEDKITRMFYGIGPNYRYLSPSKKFQTEFNTRIGLSTIKGGKVAVYETTTVPNQLLNFHAGYDLKSSLAAKAQLRFTYMFSQAFGVHAGAYYIKHFDGTELLDSTTGISTGYQKFTNSTATNNFNSLNGTFEKRSEPCNCDVSSIGVFAGVTLKLNSKPKEEECCTTCPIYALAVTARDKFTNELLANTDIAVKNLNGEVIKTGTTNSFGVVVFNDMLPNDYVIEGELYDVNMEGSTTSIGEFKPKETLQKEIIYGDRNFIITGRAFECNTTTPISGINVVLENKDLAVKKSTMTDVQGNFVLQLPATGTYQLYGRKDNYFSQIETVNGSDYNRDKNLFVKLEMCAEKVDCGKGLGLKNILFDLDKYEIKGSAKIELNRLVRFMLDNPSVKVEVGSHTDCRSSHAYNETLSQNRANASVDYVVSQGIDRSRITGKGYGETRLLNRCADGVDCSEAEHAINRRTEMKVICPE